MEAVVLHVVQCYVEEEIAEFNRIRLQVEEHADGPSAKIRRLQWNRSRSS